ncbi:hypothetical protein S83_055705 [Arachis hypogaea]
MQKSESQKKARCARGTKPLALILSMSTFRKFIKPSHFLSPQEEGKAPYLYMEVDFKEVTSKKTALIETSNQLRNKVGEAAVILRAGLIEIL